ncbi:hypothetical protein [Burkholderia sp. Bp8963]|uniref:hypothetical protein n=1 Tax=Burkholderia sp. Bp8963 TaxID=2184547 RepID=UPI000F5A88B2|nr:hypothetical protein [Burkholderia sp. Bp8963]
MIGSGVPHQERIRYATHSEFFTGSALTDRHDLPHPIFSDCTMETIPLKTETRNSDATPAPSVIAHKSTAKTFPAKPALARLLRIDTTNRPLRHDAD